MKWQGMQRRTSSIDPRPGVSVEEVNTRLGREGESLRRLGKASTNVPKQSGAVLNIQPPIGPAGAIIVFPTGGTVFGYTNPRANWDDTKDETTGDSAWRFPYVSAPVTFTLPLHHNGGTAYMLAAATNTPANGQGLIFSVYFDGVLSYTSACMDSGSDTVAIPAGVVAVQITSVTGCNGGFEITSPFGAASGT